MTPRQVVEIICDCPWLCGRHQTSDHCVEVIRVQTRSNAEARWVALVGHAWSVATEPRASYGNRPAGRKAVGDRCRRCTDWTDPEAVVFDTIQALGYTIEPNLANALHVVRRIIGLPSDP